MTKLAQLQHPDPMHLEAAAGWIQLGDYNSANDELEKIRAEWRAHPDVLDLRWLIYSHHEQWDVCLDIASTIVKIASDRVWGWVHKAYALRRATGGGIEKAKPVLLEAAKLFPDDDIIQYNLASLSHDSSTYDDSDAGIHHTLTHSINLTVVKENDKIG